MKYIWIAVAVLALAVTTHAQRGGSLNSGAALSGASTPTLSHTLPAVFNATYAQGDSSFAPSAFLPWSEAVAFGTPEPKKTLGEIAREYREQKKARTD